MSHVLLVEPDVVLSKTYRQALEQGGHTVVCSANAQDSISAMDAKCPDIIVLELQMASHNGVEFLYELRSYSDWQNIPVVVHSMVSPATVEASWEMLGVCEFLYKPKTKLAKLRQTVDGILNSETA